MEHQLFPYLKLSGAEHGLLACARLNSEGRPKLDLTLVSADCTPHCEYFEYPFALPHPTPPHLASWQLPTPSGSVTAGCRVARSQFSMGRRSRSPTAMRQLLLSSSSSSR